MPSQVEHYNIGHEYFEGYLSYEGSPTHRRPAVLVFHQWSGVSEFEKSRADTLAQLGYAAICVDMYGKGKRGHSPQENGALMMPLMNDRAELLRRIQGGLNHVRNLPMIDARQIAAIGFCFGGLCALDLARHGEEGVRGCAGIHALLAAPPHGQFTRANPMRSKVLAFHGWNDPMVRPDAVEAFAREMHDHGADWQLHAFGGCGHAFTNPAAQDAANGMQYNPDADRRTSEIVTDFLSEVFQPAPTIAVPHCPWPAQG